MPTPVPPPSPPPSGSVETELAKERTFGGGDGVDVDREIRIIDLADPAMT